MTISNQPELRGYIERIESLMEKRDEFTADIKTVFDEAGSTGLDKAVLRKVIAARKKERDDAARFKEQGDLFQVYWDSLESA